MLNFKRFSMFFLILILFLMLSGCGLVRAFNGGYYHRNYSYNSYEDVNSYGSQNYSYYNRSFCWR